MKKHFLSFFDDWRKSILFSIISIVLLIISNSFENAVFETICSILFGLGLASLFISVLYQLSKKRWLKTIITVCLIGGIIFVLLFIAVAMLTIDGMQEDKWTDNLTIPTNIQIDDPVDLDHYAKFEGQRPDSISNRIVEKTDFQLYNSFQPGLYEYDFWIGKIESGIIYIKAFEITTGERLSEDKLEGRSSVKIFNPTDSIKKFSTDDHFTIYEGDWGHPYAARFEVWFKPDNGKPERKLFSKNYKIEGWMR